MDMIEQMRGAMRSGASVVIDGREVPRIMMHDRGAEIEFILDGRMSYSFPREWAYLAAAFAGTAMAVGAGHPSLSAPHRSTMPYAPEVMRLDGLPTGGNPSARPNLTLVDGD